MDPTESTAQLLLCPQACFGRLEARRLAGAESKGCKDVKDSAAKGGGGGGGGGTLKVLHVHVSFDMAFFGFT